MGVGELRIRGRILRDTEPVEGAYITLNASPGGEAEGQTGEFIAERRTGPDGVYEFHITPGEWVLNVRAAGSDGETRQVNEERGGEREEDFNLTPQA